VGVGTASLQFDGLPVRGGCVTVNIPADGHLMCRTLEGVEVRNRHTLDTISSVKDTNITEWEEIIQPEGVMVGSLYNSEEETFEVALLDPDSLKKTNSLYKQSIGKLSSLHRIGKKIKYLGDIIDLGLSDEIYYTSELAETQYRIAQHLSLVYIVDWDEKQLIVCSLVDNNIQKFPLPGMKNPHSVCILPDSTLLIGDLAMDGKVRRYKVEDTTLTLMWEFRHISDPTGISFDPTSQLIHICTEEGPLLIFSLEGKYCVYYSAAAGILLNIFHLLYYTRK